MFYAFIDGEFVLSGKHLKYVKERTDEDMELFNGFHATIYQGKRSYYSRFYDKEWTRIGSLKPDRPELPEWARH